MRYLTDEEGAWLRKSKRCLFWWKFCDNTVWVAMASAAATMIVLALARDGSNRVALVAAWASAAVVLGATIAERLIWRRLQALGPPPTPRDGGP